jgi:hypothetical protein
MRSLGGASGAQVVQARTTQSCLHWTFYLIGTDLMDRASHLLMDRPQAHWDPSGLAAQRTLKNLTR